MMEAFKNEIVEAEKGRTDLLKWKLILVATLGAIGLGFNSSSSTSRLMISSHYLLCLVPLVCVYTDLLCKHLSIRILVISNFFQYSEAQDDVSEGSYFRSYENFCENVRPIFNLEDWAQQWSTLFLSSLVIVIAMTLQAPDCFIVLLFGILGIALTFLLDNVYDRKRANLKKDAENLIKSKTFFRGNSKTLLIQNEKLLNLMKYEYTVEELHRVSEFLKSVNTFNFHPLSTGLFPAAQPSKENQYTRYEYVWVRDNIYVSYAHYITGDFHVPCKNLNSLIDYFKIHKHRFESIINNPSIANNAMARPHVRFDGENLREIEEKWSHAQNDALGYFLWLYCKLLSEGLLSLEDENIKVLALFPLYFNAISYWKDKDSGHWEEERKVEASSIGAVIAGLVAMRQMLIKFPDVSSHLSYKGKSVTLNFLDELIQNGTNVLYEILPYECREPGSKARRYDSSLLFLIYPLKVIDGSIADQILEDVIGNLQGDYGVKRYLRDSFWAADYKKKLSPQERTVDVSDNMSQRNLLIQEGKEAQWCIFDPIISAIFGAKFKETGQNEFLKQQTFYLNRSLGQLTGEDCKAGEFKCPELYYIEDNEYIPNDVTPLLWTQANLMVALKRMEESLLLPN